METLTMEVTFVWENEFGYSWSHFSYGVWDSIHLQFFFAFLEERTTQIESFGRKRAQIESFPRTKEEYCAY